MKKLPFLLAGALALIIVSFTLPEGNVVGHWKVYHRDGMNSFVDFNSDGTYEGSTMTGQVYVKGKYSSKGDVSSITDNLCGIGYMAQYKLNFINKDSIVISAIEDSCSGRKASVDGASLKRWKDK